MAKWFFCTVVLLLLIMAWVPATSSRHLTPSHDASSQLSGTSQVPYTSLQDLKGVSKSESFRRMKELGSRPPNCEHKCDGCNPCVAIQVPTISGGHLGIQYANYEPVSWKCKCGASFYSP